MLKLHLHTSKGRGEERASGHSIPWHWSICKGQQAEKLVRLSKKKQTYWRGTTQDCVVPAGFTGDLHASSGAHACLCAGTCLLLVNIRILSIHLDGVLLAWAEGCDSRLRIHHHKGRHPAGQQQGRLMQVKYICIDGTSSPINCSWNGP